MRKRIIFFNCLAAIVAVNYFAFRVELFEEEYEANHPLGWCNTVTLSMPTLNWETFDKDNAPPAIIVDPEISLEFFSLCNPSLSEQLRSLQACGLVRDKSPPVTLADISL